MFSLFFPFMELAVLAVNFVELSPSHKSEYWGQEISKNVSSLSKIKVQSEVLLRIEVRNMKRERFNRLLVRDVTFSLLCCLSKGTLRVAKEGCQSFTRYKRELHSLPELTKTWKQNIKAARISTPQSNGEIFMCTHKKEVNINDFCFRNSICEFYFFFSHLLQRRRCNYVI